MRPGDQIEAWAQQALRYTGTVQLCAPELGVVWIVESGIGSRKMLSIDEYRLHPRTAGDH